MRHAQDDEDGEVRECCWRDEGVTRGVFVESGSDRKKGEVSVEG